MTTPASPVPLEELYLGPVAYALERVGLKVVVVVPRRLGGLDETRYLLVCGMPPNESPRVALVKWRSVSDARWEFHISCVDSLGDFHPRETSIVKGAVNGSDDDIVRMSLEIVKRVDAWLRPVLRSV